MMKQVENFNFINSYETSRELVTTDKGLLLKINYICEENIAVQDDILINKGEGLCQLRKF